MDEVLANQAYPSEQAIIGLNCRMITPTWKNIVVEAQFATELTLNGLRRLCTVPIGPEVALWGSDEQNYALHVGLYSYSSGLERLGKLALSCYGFVVDGKFTKVSGISHDIVKLLDELEALDLTKLGDAQHHTDYLVRPNDPLGPDATSMVKRFAGGTGRYEHLDSLWKEEPEVKTYKDWSELAARVSVSSDVVRLISLKVAMSRVVESAMIDLDLESTHESILPDDQIKMYEPSVGVVLSLFRTVRWVSAILDAVTYYTDVRLPILDDILSRTFLHSSEDFFNYHLVRFSDSYSVEEEVTARYEEMNSREQEEYEEDFESETSR